MQTLVLQLGLQNAVIPILLPGVSRPFLSLAPNVTPEDRMVVGNVVKITNFLLGNVRGSERGIDETPGMLAGVWRGDRGLLREMLPFLPAVATEIVPDISQRLLSRISARVLR